MGRKWILSTHLDPEELKLLRDQIDESDASWWVSINPLNGDHMNLEALKGGETLVISRKAVRHLKDHPELLAAHLRGQRIVDLRQLLKEFCGRVDLENADGWTFLLGSTYQSFMLRSYFYVKEVVELALGIILIILLSPLL